MFLMQTLYSYVISILMCYYGMASLRDFSTFIPVIMSYKMRPLCKLFYNLSIHASLRNNCDENNTELWFLKLVLYGILYFFTVMLDVKIHIFDNDPNSQPALVLIHVIYYIYHFFISKSMTQSKFKKTFVFIFFILFIFRDLINDHESL